MDDSSFLNEDELFKLTGRKQKTKQAEQLRNSGIPFTLDCFARPVVFKEALASTKAKKKQPEPPARWQPAVLGA